MKSHFKFNANERSGIFFLLLVLIAIQVGTWALDYYPKRESLLFQHDKEGQKAFDSLIALKKRTVGAERKPFNPNFISDFKGYTLGLSPIHLDRLKAFRKQNKFVNSAEEFRRVTGVSDSLLEIISPYFKFPDWVTNKNSSKQGKPYNNSKIIVKDLNKANAEELMAINGIGPALSERIIRFRNRLGGFLIDEQLYHVYGLKGEVADRVLMKFKVIDKPQIQKINVNTASVEKLATLVYLKYNVAENIVLYREKHGKFKNKDELFNVNGFPINKMDIITLYLSY